MMAFILMTGLFGLVPALAYAQVATTSDSDASATISFVSTTTAATTTVTASIDASSTAATSTAAATTTASIATSTAATSTQPVVNSNVGVEAQVRAYFASTPVMIAIASCESGFRQFDTSGNPLNGGSGGMIGIFQISAAIHASIALSMGMDINTVAGNMAYANYLYQEDGTTPWLSSFACWNPIANPSAAAQNGPTSAALYSNLVLGAVGPQVVTLQQLLNKSTTPVASSGPGSPGQETDIFGSLTKVAVKAFQCAHNIVCTGDEYSTGYGAVGPSTRAALLALSGTNAGSVSATAVVPVPMNSGPLPGGAAAATGATTASSATSTDEAAEIAQLQAEIVQLEQVLAALIKARSA
jgi:hypothetical protein